MRRDAVEPLLAQIEDQAWFFDTELLIQAERNGLRIHEVSVDWIDDPDTRVHIVSTAREDLKGVWRLARPWVDRSEVDTGERSADISEFGEHHQLARYASVGILSSLVYLILFMLLRIPLGMFAANLVAAATTATLNTLAHVSYTFRAARRGQLRHAIALGAFSFSVGIGLTTAALTSTYVFGRTSSLAEGIAILIGMVVASCLRFVLLREWAFRIHTRTVRSTSLPIASPERADADTTQAA
jgi:putative flippase GtrA